MTAHTTTVLRMHRANRFALWTQIGFGYMLAAHKTRCVRAHETFTISGISQYSTWYAWFSIEKLPKALACIMRVRVPFLCVKCVWGCARRYYSIYGKRHTSCARLLAIGPKWFLVTHTSVYDCMVYLAKGCGLFVQNNGHIFGRRLPVRDILRACLMPLI